MKSYAVIRTSIHADWKYLNLKPNEKLVFLTLLTHTHTTAVGTIQTNAHMLAALTGLTQRATQQALKALGKNQMVYQVNGAAQVIWIPNYLKHNPPENPNQIKGWAKVLPYIPQCPLKFQILKACYDLASQKGREFKDAFPESSKKEMEMLGKSFDSAGSETLKQTLPGTLQEPIPKSVISNQYSVTSKEHMVKPESDTLEEGFSRFWEIWPRKVAKAAAKRAWDKLAPDDELQQTIFQAVTRQKKGWKDPQYIPHPATWLNGSRWEDEDTTQDTAARKKAMAAKVAAATGKGRKQ